MLRQDSTKTGSVLVWTVLVIAMLSLIAVETLRLVTVKYQNALQTSTWQEALLAAESGIDLAIVELRKSLYPQPNHAWEPPWGNPPGNEITSSGATDRSDELMAILSNSHGWDDSYYRTGPHERQSAGHETAQTKLTLGAFHQRHFNATPAHRAAGFPSSRSRCPTRFRIRSGHHVGRRG